MINDYIAKSVPNLLLVEDHEPLRKFWSEQLADLGFTVTAADTADQAQTIIQNGTPVDVLLSDISMPGRLNGLQLARWVRRYFPSIIILLQTGLLDDLPPEFRVLRKPFTVNDFMSNLEQALKESGKLAPTPGVLGA